MVAVPYGAGTYGRPVAGLPEVRLVNQYAEKSPIAGVILVARPGLVESYTLASGPVRGMFSKPGSFGGDLFVLAGTTLYRAGTAIGTVAGTSRVRMDGNELEVLIATGAGLYRTDGATVVQVATPDNSGVADVAYLASRFLFVRTGTGKIYWSDVLDGTTIDPASFATAEAMPDPLIGLQLVGDVLWLFGQSSVEFWTDTGDIDAPFAPIDGRVYSRGCAGRDTIVEADNTGIWVGEDRIVYRGGATPERISDHGIETRIKTGDLAAWTFPIEGHRFYVLRSTAGTFAYDFATGQWSEFASAGRANWRAHVGVAVNGEVFAGDDASGAIWRLDTTAAADHGATMQRIFTAGVLHNGAPVPCNNLMVDASVGQTALLSGQGSDPLIEMRFSRDGGNTWSDWDAASLGAQGQYRTRAAWRRLGLIDRPGRVFEFRVTDPAPWQLSGVRMNEIAGGLSR